MAKDTSFPSTAKSRKKNEDANGTQKKVGLKQGMLDFRSTSIRKATTRATSLKRTRASDLAVLAPLPPPPPSSSLSSMSSISSPAGEFGTGDLSTTASSPIRTAKFQKLSATSDDEESLLTSPTTDAAVALISNATASVVSSSSGSRSRSTYAASESTINSTINSTTKSTTKSTSNVIAAANTKTNNKASAYADPSKYAHLKELTDIIEPNLIGIFVGFNPGIATATAGHAYAHPSNRFWKLLHESGITDKLCRPVHDRHLPRLYQMGNTNIVARPSKDIGELAEGEMAAGTPGLEAKVRKFKPESVCIVGKAIWEGIWQHWYGKRIKREEFKYGWQDEKHNMGVDGGNDHDDEDDEKQGEGGEGGDKMSLSWRGARVFVATSTSGLSTIPTYPQKVEIWKDYGNWVNERRAALAKEKEVAAEEQ